MWLGYPKQYNSLQNKFFKKKTYKQTLGKYITLTKLHNIIYKINLHISPNYIQLFLNLKNVL